MLTNCYRFLLGVAAVALLCVVSLAGQPTSFSTPVSLDVPGRSDSTPWIAARGSFVAVAWGASAAGKTDVFLAVSRDGGATFGSPVQVNTVKALTVSRDGGRTFSTPARVSEDGWAINGCPDDGPAIAVDAKGSAHLVWPTVINGPTPKGALFYASTRDGAKFTPRVRIPTLGGPKPSHPQIVVDANGRIFVAWDESIAGRRMAAVRELRPQPNRPAVFGEIVRLSAESAASYPVLAVSDKGLVAVWTTGGGPPRVETRIIPKP